MKKIILLFVTLCSVCCAVEIMPSSLDPDRADRREQAFEDWIPVAESQIRFDELNKEGVFPIYSERIKGKVRDIFIDQPDGLAYWTWGGMSEQDLISKHKKYTMEGFVLLSLAVHDDGLYWATWINESRERKVLRQLRRFGISQGSIKFK